MKRAITGIAAAGLALGMMVPAAFAATTTSTVQWKSVNITAGSYTAAPKGFTADDYGSTTPTTFAPVYYVQQAMKALGYTVKWDGTNLWVTTPANATPDLSNISVGTGNAGIYVNGTLVKKVYTQVMKDPLGGAHAVNTTYVPIFYIDALLKAAGENATWDGSGWAMTAPSAVATALTAKQTAATKVEADFNGPVASGTAVTLTQNGTTYNTTATWSADMKTATLDTGYNLPAGTYTVTAGSMTGTVTITTAVPSAINVTSAGLSAVDGAPLSYTVDDQFGNAVSNLSAGDFNVSAFDSTKGATVTVTPGTTAGNATLALHSAGATLGDSIIVTVTEPSYALSKTVTLPVVGVSKISTLAFGKATLSGSTNVSTSATGAVLPYTATNASGDSVMFDANQLGGSGNNDTIDQIQFLSSNSSIVNPNSFRTDASGNLLFDTGATAGNVTITAVNLTTGVVSTSTIDVGSSTGVSKFTIGAPSGMVTVGSAAVIPYTATDSFGNAVSQADFGSGYEGNVSITSSNPAVVPNDYSTSTPQLSSQHVYFDSSSNALNVMPVGTGTTTLYVYVNGTLQNSVTLNVNAAVYPVSIAGSSALQTDFVADTTASETVSASDFNVINQYNSAYTPSSTDSIKIAPASGVTAGLFTVDGNTTGDTKSGTGSFTIVPAANTTTGSEEFTVTIDNGTNPAVSYNVTLNAIGSGSVTGYSLTAPATLYDGGAGYVGAMTKANYAEGITVNGTDASGHVVVLPTADQTPGTLTSSNTSIVSVSGNKISGLAAGSATVTAYDATGNKLASTDVTVAGDYPVAKTVSLSTTTLAEAGKSAGYDATADAKALITVQDQYGVDLVPLDGFFTSSNSAVATGGSALTIKGTGTATITYVTSNGLTASFTLTN